MIVIRIAPIEIRLNDKLTAIIDAFEPINEFKPLRGLLRDDLGNDVKQDGTNSIHRMMWDLNGLSASGPHHNISPSSDEFTQLVAEVQQIRKAFGAA
jgi:hypothetical protein